MARWGTPGAPEYWINQRARHKEDAQVSAAMRDARLAAPPPEAVEWARAAGGSDAMVRRVRPLTGGRTSAIHAIDLEQGARRLTVVLRRWTNPDWVRTDPDFTPAREAHALREVEALYVRTPRLLALDDQGARCGVPALLMSLVPGHAPPTGGEAVRKPSFVGQLARAVAEVHRSADGRGLSVYRPYNDLRDPRPPAHSSSPATWSKAFEVVAGSSPETAECFIHRDFHPGNTLWVDRRMTGVVDWGYSSWGPPSIDLAHMRWNLVAEHGQDVANSFTAAYLDEVEGFRHHAYWDLRTVVDLAPEPIDSTFTPVMLDRIERYLDDLLRAM
jgi:aminoglycoside phosphotransferase (APT) family kinase protein